MEKYVLEVTTDEENMAKAMAFIEEHTQVDDNPKVSGQMVLVGEELVFNVFSYAYEGQPGTITLSISVCPEQRQMCMEIRDSGKAYNPLLRQDPDVSRPISEREIGGLGVMISKKLTDEQRYVRENGQNILTVVKKY